MSTFSKSPIIFTYVDKKANEEFYRNFGTQQNILMFRPKRSRYAEYTSDPMDAEALKMFIDGVIGGNGRYTRLDTFPSFEYHTDDL